MREEGFDSGKISHLVKSTCERADEKQNEIRIALVAPVPPPPGGIGRWTEGLLQFIKNDSSVRIELIDTAVRYRSIWNLNIVWRIAGGGLHALLLFIRFVRTLLSRRIDVVHITTSGSLGMFRDITFMAVARLLGIRSVLHMRGGRLPKAIASRTWESKVAQIAFRLADSAIVLDTMTLDALRLLVPECPVSVIENPAWQPMLPSLSSRKVVQNKKIIYIGWVIPAKGIRELVLACRDLRDPEFQLDLIGPIGREFRNELEELARSNRNGEWLTISGAAEIEETMARIASGAFVVLPSYSEGCPNVVLEAMMLGKAVVATPVGAIPKLLSFDSENPCGICVPVGDADALRTAINSLLNDPVYANALGKRGNQRVLQYYSPQVIYPQYRTIWRRCAKSH